MAKRSFVHVVQYGHLWTKDNSAPTNGTLELDFHHVSGAHPSALGHAVDQRLIQVDDQCLFGCLGAMREDIRGLASWHERPRCSRSTGIFQLRGGRT